MNQKEQVFLNSCQLLLQQFSTKHKGLIYFVWKKGKKHIQSLKYQCSEQSTPMKETLSLSLKTYAVNGVMQKRYTHFLLFDGDGRELEHIRLQVTEWKPQSTQRKLVLGSCNLRIKVRRKVALQLQNFHRHSKTQIQQSSEQQDQQISHNIKLHKKQQLGIKEQLAKAKREIQDFDYITNKLKNDRNFYIAENETFRNKLAEIHQQYAEQIMKLKTHYQTRIQIRQSIYQEEIQELITTFNSNYQINRALIEGLVQEKQDYEAEIQQMKEMHTDYIQKQEINFQGKIAQLQEMKKEIERQFQDSLTKISQKQNHSIELQKEIAQLQKQLKQTKAQLQQQIAEHKKDNQKWEKEVEERQVALYKKGQEIQALCLQIDNKDFQLTDNQTAMENYRTLVVDFQKTIVDKDRLNHQLETEKYNLSVEIEKLKVIIQEQTNQIEFHKASIQQLKEQDRIKYEDYMTQYRNLETIYNQKQIGYTNQIKAQHQKYLELSKQNYDLNVKIQQLEHDSSLLRDQLNIMKNDHEQNLQMTEQLRQQMKQQAESFTKQYRQYNEQIADLMGENNVFEAETAALKEEIREMERKAELQAMNLKQEYENLVESKNRLFQDQLQFSRKQRQADMENFQRLKKQYQDQLANMIQRQQNENQQTQKLFRDELDIKNKEFLQLNESYKILHETYEDLKLRLEIVEEERNHLMQVRGGKRHGDEDGLEIEEIEEESQEEESEEQEQSEEEDSESSQDNKKKKKKTAKNKQKPKGKQKDNKKKGKSKQKQKANKKKKKQTSSEQQSQSNQPSEHSQQQEVSQILANFSEEEDSFDKHIKNLAQTEGKKAGSEKVIPAQQNIEQSQAFNKQPQVSTGNVVVSIPVPEVVPYQPSQPSQPQPKTKKQAKQRKERRDSTDRKQRRSQKSLSSKKKKKRHSSEDQKSQKDSQNSKAKGRQKIKELQKQIKTLKKQIKQHERNEMLHLAQIQQQEEEIKSLNMEMDALIKKIGKKDPKLARKISSQIQEKREEKSLSNKSIGDISSMRVPPMPRKEVEKLKVDYQNLKRATEEKTRAIANLQNQKNALLFKLQTAQALKNELQKKTNPQPNTVGSQIEQGLKRSVLQMQGKFMSQKQRAQEIKLQLNKVAFEKEQLQNENKKLRIKLQDLQEFIKKNQPTQTQKEMQKELEDYNRQFLQMSKSLNSAKLEKQAAQQELRLMKKRYSQIIRQSQEAETKAANLQRQAQDLRRKENKSRRDIQDYLQEIRKYKDQIKTLQHDMNSLNTVQSQSLYQRKKVMDQIMKLEDALSNKEFQVIKLTKEIDKLKNKLQQGDDLKVNKRNQLLLQKERLGSLLIKAEKRIQQLQQQEKLLKHKITLLQQQAKKNLQQRKQTYGDKLRFYIEQITNIKQIVQEYQSQNSRLKIQNSQLYEHNQILKISFEKLEVKYQQMVESEERLLGEIDAMQKEMDGLGQEQSRFKLQIEANSITIANLRKQLDTQRTVSKKKSDKLTAYEQLNEKYLYQIKTLKIKLSEFQTNLNQNQLLVEKHQKNTKTIQQLQHELKTLQEEYNKVINTYTYKKEDVEQAMRELKEHQEKVKEEEITRVIEELDSTHSQKQASMEQEIIQLFNQNSKLRLSLQQKSDQSNEYRLKITELQQLPQKLKLLQKQRDNLQTALYQLSQQFKTVSQQLRRAESKLNQSIRSQEGKQTQNVILSKKLQDLERKFKDLSESYTELKKQEKRLNQRAKQSQSQKDKMIQKLGNDVQHYQNKILSLELEVGRLKQTQSSSSRQYVKKIKKLQEKIQQMSDTFKQHQETLEAHYVGEIKKLQDSIQRLSDELQQKMQRIQQLNEALIMLQQENDDLVGELTSTRTQMAEENEGYTSEVNVLRNQLRQAEAMYDSNIKHLQEQMSSLSKELTILRYNRQQGLSGSRLAGSSAQDNSSTTKRLQQKLRMRDKRIEELKNQLLTMEQSLTKLVKKENTTESLSQAELDKLRVTIGTLQGDLYDLHKKHQTDTTALNQQLRSMRKQLIQWKSKNQQKELCLEEKQLQMDSMKVQLKTTKQLYLQLQQQLQKRKTHLNTQIQQQSQLQAQIRLKNLKITELSQKLQQVTASCHKHEAELKRKSLQVKRLTEKINELEINYRQALSSQQKRNAQIRMTKQLHRQTEQKLQKCTTESKKLKNQMTLWQKQNHQLKQQLQYNTKSLLETQTRLESLKFNNTQHEHFARRYNQIDQLIMDEYQMTLQQFIQSQYWNEKLNGKDQDIQVLAQQLEELRFLYDHKLLQLDELKKAKYQLQLKTQDNEFVYRQLDEVRVLCSRLQEEKKDAVFREEAMKLQLQNLIQSQDRNNITQKLETILHSYYEE